MSYLALVDKIHRLEAQHEHDRRIWEEELKEERRARREDIRILREAMYPFYKFMEQDVPQKFDDVEDKIEGVVDRQQQLQERVITVDDSTMALEDRVADLENEREHNERVDKNGNEDMNHGDKFPRKRLDQVSDLDHSASAGTEHSPAIHGENVGIATADSKSTSPPSTPTPSDKGSFHPGFITSHFMSTTTPTPSDRGHVQVRSSSPRDLTSDPMSRARIIIPERHSFLQSVNRGQSGIESGDDTVINSRPARTSSFNDNTISSSPSPSPSPSPLYHALSPSSGPIPADNRKTLKRKRYMDELQPLDSTATRNRLSLPIPSPLSLSNTNADSLWCKITDVNRAYTSSSCSSFALTH